MTKSAVSSQQSPDLVMMLISGTSQDHSFSVRQCLKIQQYPDQLRRWILDIRIVLYFPTCRFCFSPVRHEPHLTVFTKAPANWVIYLQVSHHHTNLKRLDITP